MRIFILLTAVVFGVACSSKLTSKKGGDTKYEEDLSALRDMPAVMADTVRQVDSLKQALDRDPARYVEARHAITETLDGILDSISMINLAEGTVDGYTIQLFSGPNLERAMNSRKELAIAMPEMKAELEYVQPNYKVRTGEYYTRLEAQPDYLAIKRHFPNAIVLPNRIRIRR